jgi:hypothetical protein
LIDCIDVGGGQTNLEKGDSIGLKLGMGLPPWHLAAALHRKPNSSDALTVDPNHRETLAD